MDKPREWWIYREPNSNRAIVAAPGETRAWEGIHVIEYSAYEFICEYNGMLNRELSGQQELAKRMAKERDYAREANDNAFSEFAKAAQERNAARDEVADWRQQLVAERMKSAKLAEALNSAQRTLYKCAASDPEVDEALAEHESQDSNGEQT